MGSVADRLRRNAVRHVLAPDGVIYKIRRVRSADLAEHAVVELVGGLEVQKEIERIQKEQKAEREAWKREHVDPAEREEFDRKEAEREAHAQKTNALAMARTVAKSPALFKGWMDRIDAYCCAGVVGAGIPDEHLFTDDIETGPAPDSFMVNTKIEPLRFCMKEEQEDPEASRLWIGDFDGQTKQFLAESISELSGSPTVTPFRR
jgi:hypothetical protein